MADSESTEQNPANTPPSGDLDALARPAAVPNDGVRNDDVPSHEAASDIAVPPDEPLSAIVLDTPSGRVPGPGLLAAIGWSVLLFVGQVGIVIVAAVPAVVLGYPQDRMMSLLFPLGGATILLLAVALCVAMFGWRTPAVLGLRRLGVGPALLVFLTVAPMTAVASQIATWAAKVLPTFNEETYKELAQEPFWLVLIVGCILPALGEEVFFRGFVGRGLVARYGIAAGGLLSAVIFGLMHIDPVQATALLVMGLLLQGVFIATKSLLAPMLLHGLNNALSFAAMKYDDSPADAAEPTLLLVSATGGGGGSAPGGGFLVRGRRVSPGRRGGAAGLLTAERRRPSSPGAGRAGPRPHPPARRGRRGRPPPARPVGPFHHCVGRAGLTGSGPPNIQKHPKRRGCDDKMATCSSRAELLGG